MLLTTTLNCFSRTIYLVCPSIQKKSWSMHAKNSKIQNQDVLFIFLAPTSAILKSTIIFFMSLYNYTIIHTVFVYILCIKYFLYIYCCLPKQTEKVSNFFCALPHSQHGKYQEEFSWEILIIINNLRCFIPYINSSQ